MDELKAICEYDTTQYIVSDIGDEQYGIDIKFVENIVRMQSMTRVSDPGKVWRTKRESTIIGLLP